jgi:hypothetical protein
MVSMNVRCTGLARPGRLTAQRLGALPRVARGAGHPLPNARSGGGRAMGGI